VKRFTETTKWDDPWFMDLPGKYKNFWAYICDRCDCAGTWEPNMRLAVAQIGEPLELSEILRVFTGRIVQLKDGKLWVTKFIEFQYGVLSPDCKPHLSVLKRLDTLGLSKEYPKGIYTLQEKEKEKEQEKDGRKISKKPLSAFRNGQPDSEWLAQLQQNPAYEGLDVKRHFFQCVEWWRQRGITPTRQRILNWLNKQDKPIHAKQPIRDRNAYINKLNEEKARLMRMPRDQEGNLIDRDAGRELYSIESKLAEL